MPKIHTPENFLVTLPASRFGRTSGRIFDRELDEHPDFAIYVEERYLPKGGLKHKHPVDSLDRVKVRGSLSMQVCLRWKDGRRATTTEAGTFFKTRLEAGRVVGVDLHVALSCSPCRLIVSESFDREGNVADLFLDGIEYNEEDVEEVFDNYDHEVRLFYELD